jgi:hypothetical protein
MDFKWILIFKIFNFYIFAINYASPIIIDFFSLKKHIILEDNIENIFKYENEFFN